MSFFNFGQNDRPDADSGRAATSRERRGVTLTELLVVVSIIVLLSASLVPLVQPVLRGQRVREAARQLNVYLSGAQARAVELGRPVGVWIERAGHEPTDPLNSWYTGYRLYLAEQPAPYTGDMYDARVRLVVNAADPTIWQAYYTWNPTVPLSCCDYLAASFQQAASTLDPRLAIALPGDMIRFNGRGPYYVIDEIQQDKLIFRATLAQSTALMKYFRTDPTSPSQLLAFQPGVRFEIVRRPMKSSDTPLELPRNTAVDLSLSGYGPPYASPYNAITAYDPFVYDPTQFAARFREINPEYDIVIMFKPEGGVDRVYYVAHELDVLSFWEIPQGMINLLVARDDQIGRDSLRNMNIVNVHDTNVIGPLGEANLRDQDNIWLSISTITGRIQSSPNGDAFVDAMTGVPLLQLPLQPTDDARMFLENARRFATTGQSLGGQQR